MFLGAVCPATNGKACGLYVVLYGDFGVTTCAHFGASMQVVTFLQCYLFLPLGGVLLVSCLAGSRHLNSLTNGVCQQRVQLGLINLRLVSLILLLSLGFFSREHIALMRIYTSPGYAQYCGNTGRIAVARNVGLDEKAVQHDPVAAAASAAAAQAAAAAMTTGEAGLHCMAYKLRHERNWWLSLLSFTMWMLVWRMTALLSRYDMQLRQLETQKRRVLADINDTKKIVDGAGPPEPSTSDEKKVTRVSAVSASISNPRERIQ